VVLALKVAEDVEDLLWLGADAEVGMGFGEGYGAVLTKDEGGGKREAPGCVGSPVVACAGVGERNVDEDGTEVGAGFWGNGIGEAELRGEVGMAVREQRKSEVVLLGGEAVLAFGLRGDGHDKGAGAAEIGKEIAPGFELGNAVRTPAAAKEIEDERAKREQVSGGDELAGGGVGKVEERGRVADLENAIFDAGGEELCGGVFGDGEAIGLHEIAGAGGDGVELVLEAGHRLELYCKRAAAKQS